MTGKSRQRRFRLIFLPSIFLPSFRASSDGKTDAGKKIDGKKIGAKEIYSNSHLPVMSGSRARILFRIIPNIDFTGFRQLHWGVPMNPVEHKQFERELGERLATSGFRFTSQRRRVYDVLLQKLDHPTAEDVFMRAKRKMPDISHATVYNCLDALVQCGLVRKVQLERGATRFCPNMEEHAHYYCDTCGAVFDVSLPAEQPSVPRPRGFKVDHFEIAVHGLCADCAKKK